ncbi:MAG: hypothetical protein LRY76_07920 [Alphaproteobacteria bacterium]|nr:hypothetical protein [Alphaproteobacteria bacterium]MCD8571427.1 hypothetical protein [Alphaproteobacteria bacterium]
MSDDNKGQGILARLWENFSPAPALNPDNKKVVFLVGRNATAHHILRHAVPALAGLGIHVDIYLTRMPDNPKLQEKLNIPENKRFSFYEQLPINIIYPLLHKKPTIVDGSDLRASLQYSPKQVATYCQKLGVKVNVQELDDPNDPAFVKKIQDDPDIVLGYNIRSMHILKQPLINAFEAKSYGDIPGYIANAHPGELPVLPGTHTAFWGRKNKRTWMEWALHVIDTNIDTGPTLDTCSKQLSPKKTLMQDLMSMSEAVAQMLVSNTRLFFQHRPRPALPQNTQLRPSKNYTYPTHKEWDDSWIEGIRPVNPDDYAEALTLEYTGYKGTELTCSKLARQIRKALDTEIQKFEVQYVQEYQKVYAKNPPVYTPPHMLPPPAAPDPNAPQGPSTP